MSLDFENGGVYKVNGCGMVHDIGLVHIYVDDGGGWKYHRMAPSPIWPFVSLPLNYFAFANELQW